MGLARKVMIKAGNVIGHAREKVLLHIHRDLGEMVDTEDLERSFNQVEVELERLLSIVVDNGYPTEERFGSM